MAKLVFGRKTSRAQRPRVDRFVMPRDSLVDSRRRSWRTGCEIDTVHIWHAKHQQQKKYKNHLDEAFGLEPSNYQEIRRSEEECIVQPWPCAPRRKSYLSSIDSILDLPTYNNATFPELIDWSDSDFLVAALGRNYHMFSWPAQCVVSQGGTRYEIQCCKFDPRGELLLIGTDMKSVEVHNSVWSLWTANGKCECSKVDINCSITAVDWSPTGNSFVTGCSRGTVNTFDRAAFLMHSWRNSSGAPIRAVKVSPDARYVALTLVNAYLVHILAWPGLQYQSCFLDSNWFVKTITWHPWRSALLAVGAVTSKLETTIAFCDTSSTKFKVANLGRTHYILDEMLFSHRTGELVLSLWNLERASRFPNSSQLVVMSDPDTVVDRSSDGRGGLDRIRTMVFSPDGTKLATATSDEDLIIWNFLPEDNKKKKTTKSRRFSAIPVYLDQLTQGFVLR